MPTMVLKKKEARREQILEAAVEVFGEMGYHAANVADVIARAGVARGTFYQYFENKRQVFDELLDDLLGTLGITGHITPSFAWKMLLLVCVVALGLSLYFFSIREYVPREETT